MENTINKMTVGNDGVTKLHRVAMNGDLEEFKILFEMTEDKNPSDNQRQYVHSRRITQIQF